MTLADRLKELLDDFRRHDSAFWRRAIQAGATYGPDAWVRYSPPLFGLAFGLALRRQRRAVLRNIEKAAGPTNSVRAHALAAEVFVNFAASLTEAFLVATDRAADIRHSLVGDENFIGAARAGCGVIVATAHTSGWQAAGAMLRNIHDADVVMVMQPERDARAQALQDAARDRAGIRVVHVGGSPLDALGLLGHLRRGGVVAVQIDRVPDGMRARRAELFGEPWLVPEGPLVLSAVSGAPIIPVFTRRLGYMHYEVQIAPAVRLPRRPSGAELDGAARRLASEMQRFVTEHPTQWMHFA